MCLAGCGSICRSWPRRINLAPLSIFDALLDKLFTGETEAEQSGEYQDRSCRTHDYAVSTPIVEATELLVELLNSQDPRVGSGVPPEIKSRLERLFKAPGEGADHAAYVVASQLRWLDHIDPEWVRATIVPWFDLEHPVAESAWNGFSDDNCLPEPKLFSLIKSDFLKAIVHVAERKRLHEFLVLGCFWHQSNNAYITFEETRQVLQNTNDSGRAHSLWFFTRIVDGNDAWRRFGKPFLERAWPKESRFQTEETSRHLVALAKGAGDFFPEVVQTILPYLVPMSRNIGFVSSLARQSDEETGRLPTRSPDATLMLIDKIIPDDPDPVPYELDSLTEIIAEAEPSLRQDSRWRRLKALALHE